MKIRKTDEGTWVVVSADTGDPIVNYSTRRECREYVAAERANEETGKEVKKASVPKVKKASVPKVKTGVIATIVSLVEKAPEEGITKKEILGELVRQFPDREEKALRNTVNSQVPWRINKQRFPLQKVGKAAFRPAA